MNLRLVSPPRNALALALMVCLSACGGSAADAAGERVAAHAPRNAAAQPPAIASDEREAALADEIAANLQACSYDGSPVSVAASKFGANLPSDCRDMVAQIMKFTGLPQNFKVMEAPVPNAAAVIMLDAQKIPQRVIAFNRDFLNIVRSATGGNAWAPVSIMAHEIGHHLSGHTITPGGSQPPTELEADKFSGFVLYKMGATLDDAQKAMATLVAEGPDGATHPGRGKRLTAIKEGWVQACEQQGRDDCASGTGLAAQQAPPTSSGPGTPAPLPDVPMPAPAPIATAPIATAPIGSATNTVDRLPAPGSTPAKFDRFIYDEYGYLDPTWRAKFEQEMFGHARQSGVEIVTLLVKDLHGLSGDDYALAMMRQLRVGKLDVGNGALLVVAPAQNQVGIAMGPGVALEMQWHDKKAQLQRWVDSAWTNCERKRACGLWTENFMLASDHIRRDTDDMEWTIRYSSLGELMTTYNAYNDARRDSDAGFDADADPSFRKIAQVEGVVVATDLSADYPAAFVNAHKLERARAVHLRSGDYTAVLYLAPGSESLMPAGALQPGHRYRFTARVDSLSWNPKDTQSFDALSYDRID